MTYGQKYPGSRGHYLYLVSAVLDPYRAASDLVKPLDPSRPAQSAYREAERASWLSIQSLYISAQAEELRQAAEDHQARTGSSGAPESFLKFVALAAKSAMRDEAERNARMPRSGEGRMRKARIQLGAVWLQAAEGAADPYGAAVTWLFDLKEGQPGFRNERRNLEREVNRYIHQNFTLIREQLAVGASFFATGLFPVLIKTQGDARIADELRQTSRRRMNVHEVENAINSAVDTGRLFELTAVDAKGPRFSDALLAAEWLLQELNLFLRRCQERRPAKVNKIPSLNFWNITFGQPEGGA